jgi:exodeoxyribonuclease VII large subunit
MQQGINILVAGVHADLALKNRSMLYNQERVREKALLLLNESNRQLDNLEKNVHNMSPFNVLKRGYSITLLKGKAIGRFTDVKADDQLETILYDGRVQSVVRTSSKTNNL